MAAKKRNGKSSDKTHASDRIKPRSICVRMADTTWKRLHEIRYAMISKEGKDMSVNAVVNRIIEQEHERISARK